MNDLTAKENKRFKRLENVVSKNLQAFYEVGAALLEIRNSKFYRYKYGTFADYVRARWDMGYSYAHKMMDASIVQFNLKSYSLDNSGFSLPANESQTRPLARLPVPLQIEIWKEVVATAPGGKITAVYVAAVALRMSTENGGDTKQLNKVMWNKVLKKLNTLTVYILERKASPINDEIDMKRKIDQKINLLIKLINFEDQIN